jgi:hypothetical protein
MALFYFAAWTDSGCLLGCDHQHGTVTSAVACAAPVAGGYVIAVENGVLRALNEEEETEFQYAMYGFDTRVEAGEKNADAMLKVVPVKWKWLLN